MTWNTKPTVYLSALHETPGVNNTHNGLQALPHATGCGLWPHPAVLSTCLVQPEAGNTATVPWVTGRVPTVCVAHKNTMFIPPCLCPAAAAAQPATPCTSCTACHMPLTAAGHSLPGVSTAAGHRRPRGWVCGGGWLQGVQPHARTSTQGHLRHSWEVCDSHTAGTPTQGAWPQGHATEEARAMMTARKRPAVCCHAHTHAHLLWLPSGHRAAAQCARLPALCPCDHRICDWAASSLLCGTVPAVPPAMRQTRPPPPSQPGLLGRSKPAAGVRMSMLPHTPCRCRGNQPLHP